MRQTERRPPPTTEEKKTVDEVFQIYTQSAAMRSVTASHWEEVAELVMPDQRNTFYKDSFNWPGEKKTQRQVDASGMAANIKFAAICDSMITPFSSEWHTLEASDPVIQKNRQVREWFDLATKILFHLRYTSTANFRKQNQKNWQSIGAFGNGPLFCDQLYDMHGRPARGLRYAQWPVGQVFIRTNFQGQVDAFVRAFRMTARQAMQQWGHDMLPDALDEAQDKQSEQLFDFFHCVYPNSDYDPDEGFTPKGKPFYSCYVSVTERRLMQEGGYYSFPLTYLRYTEAPNEIHGRGWAMAVLPSLKTLNAQKATYLKVGHRAADPVLLMSADTKDFSLVSGAQNVGFLTDDGKPLAQALTTGNLNFAKEMMLEERAIIDDASLTGIFKTLVENPNMTATQVIEILNQKGIFLAPTVGSMASDLEPLIEREIDLAMQMRLLPPMPPILKEAKGEYKIVYTSPLFKAARAGKASGFLRTLSSALEIAGQTGDPSALDWANIEVAFPDIARIQDTPEAWIRTDEAIAQRRQGRAQQQQQEQQIQALPAQAAMLKAQAQVSKRTGGALPPGLTNQQAA